MTSQNSNSKKEVILLKPPPTPIQLEGDHSRGLLPPTYHHTHGILQQAPQISLKNQTVLEEDQYIEALSHIIKRDFFPCLEQFEKHKIQRTRTRTQSPSTSTYLQQHSPSAACTLTHSHPQNSHTWEDGGPTPRIPQTCTPGMTPLGVTNSFADTPLSSSNSTHLLDPIASSKTAKSYDQSLSLDQFCSRYTSEDNSSFSEILNNANRLKRIKYSWAFDSSSKHNNRLLESTLKREHLISAIGRMAEGGHGVGLIEGIPGKPGERKMVENVVTREERLAIEASDQQEAKLMITQAGEEIKIKGASNTNRPTTTTGTTQVTAIDTVTDRHAQSIKNPDSWPHVTRSALMFGPDANTCSDLAPKPTPFPVKPAVLPGGPKSINHASTRMVDDYLLVTKLERSRANHLSSRHSESILSPTRSQIATAINPDQSSSSTPKVNGFSFVPELPTPNLKSSSELDQLMTWGEIVSTPIRVDDRSGSTSITGGEEDDDDEEIVDRGRFKICKTPRREQLAIGMARKASQSLRQKYGYSSGLSTSSNHTLRKSLLGDGHSPSRSFRSSDPTSSVKTPSKRDLTLSPAAQRLLKKTASLTPSKLHSSSTSTTTTRMDKSGSTLKKAGIFSPVINNKDLKRSFDQRT